MFSLRKYYFTLRKYWVYVNRYAWFPLERAGVSFEPRMRVADGDFSLCAS